MAPISLVLVCFLRLVTSANNTEATSTSADGNDGMHLWSERAGLVLHSLHVTNPSGAAVFFHQYFSPNANATANATATANADAEKKKDKLTEDQVISLVGKIVEIIVQAIIWCVYHTKVLTKKPLVVRQQSTDTQSLQGGSFRHDLFAVCGDCDTLVLACCAQPCRTADTYVTAGLIDRKHLLITVFAFYVFGSCLNWCYFPCKRTALREHLGGRVHSKPIGGRCGCGSTTGEDLVLVSVCHGCTVIQEARAIDTLGEMKTTKYCAMSHQENNEADLMSPIRVSHESGLYGGTDEPGYFAK